jgi:hypothetical protein
MQTPRQNVNRIGVGSVTTQLLLAAGASVGLLGLSSAFLRNALVPKPSMITVSSIEPSTADLRYVLVRSGLTPRNLAAAGVTSESLPSVVSAVRGVMAENEATLRQADADYRTATATVERLERLTQAGLASAEDLQSLQNARSARSQAASTRTTVVQLVFESGLGQVNAGADLTLLRENAARPTYTKHRIAERTDPQWTTLRDASSNVREAADAGRNADPISSSTVAAADAEPAAVTAGQRLAHAREIQAAWLNSTVVQP